MSDENNDDGVVEITLSGCEITIAPGIEIVFNGSEWVIVPVVDYSNITREVSQ